MLSPLAAQNPDLLRIIGAGQVTTKAQLAADLGREKGNLHKTLSKLEEEGLVEWPALTERGKACLVAFDVATGKVAIPAGMIVLRHDKIRRSALNPREDWESPEAIADLIGLRESILLRGLRTNLQVRPTDTNGEFEIIDGERRWRAIGEAIFEGDLPADFPIICLVKDVTDRELMLDATDANVQRRDLSPIEEGRQFKHLRDAFEVSTLEISERIGKSQKYVQDRIRLTEMDPALQARMSLPADDPRHLGMKEARGIFQKPKEEPKPKPLELSPKLALALLELADKVENDPAGRGEPGFTRLAMRPAGGPLATLNDRKIVCLREYGGEVFAKILIHGSGAGAWLEAQGFYGERRTEVLWMARTAIMKPEKASELTRDGKYIIPELNVERSAEVAEPDDQAEEAATVNAPEANPVRQVTCDEATDDTITPAQLLILAEVTDKVRTAPVRTSYGVDVTYVLASVRDDEAALRPLKWGGYLAYGNDGVSDFLRPTEAAERILKAKGLGGAAALMNARALAARRRVGSDVYVTPWLNKAREAVVDTPEHTPDVNAELSPPPTTSFARDQAGSVVADLIDRPCEVLITLVDLDGAPRALADINEDSARALCAELASAGRFQTITIHHRSGTLLQHWG